MTATGADRPVPAFITGPGPAARGSGTGPLRGLTVAVKDVIDVEGLPTGAGHPLILRQARPATRHATAVARLLGAGADVVGKAHTDELAFALDGYNHHYGAPLNPAAPDRLTGGSSSGCASAVAAGDADIGLGTDTGGSIRVPASYCGLYSFRPTHGRVPLDGVTPLAPSFSTAAIMTRDGPTLSAAGAALLAGRRTGAAPGAALVLAEDLLAAADPEVAVAVRERARLLDPHAGSADVSRGRLGSWLERFRARQLREAWLAHGSWVEANRPEFGPGVSERMAQARRAGEPEPLEQARAEVVAAVEAVIAPGGLLALPATPAPAPPRSAGADPEVRARTMLLTCVASLGGLPVLTFPTAGAGGLPVGLCLIGRPGDDELLLAVAAGA